MQRTFQIHRIQCQLKTGTSCFSNIGPYTGSDSCMRQWTPAQQVFHFLKENIGTTIDTIPEKAEIQSEVNFCGGFPFQVRITELSKVYPALFDIAQIVISSFEGKILGSGIVR